MKELQEWRRTGLICLLLSLVTLAVFWPLSRCDFINFDDPEYVLENPHVQSGLTGAGVAWALQTGHAGNWHPLTWISHMLDWQLYGLKAGGHHVTNLLFHLANTLLLFLVLKRMTAAPWRSAFVAGLFALHPLHVESVAWISERKDVLSTLFWMLTLWAYVRYVGESKVQSPRSKVFYLLSLALLALGLMSKPMLVTLPCVLLLLDYWPLRRFESLPGKFDFHSLRRLLLEKLPFFALALGVSLVTFWVHDAGGAVRTFDRFPLNARILNAAVAYLSYLEKMFWPADLSILYLLSGTWPASKLALAVVVLAGVSGAAIRFAGRPYVLVGWLWFLGTLVPVIGLVQVGNQAMADRYTYVPLIGLFIIVTWGAWDLAREDRRGQVILSLLGGLALTGCAFATRFQLSHWQNSRTLFEHALEVSPDNYTAHNNLGNVFAQEGKMDEAKGHYLAALRSNPAYAGAAYNLGVLCALQGQPSEAVEYLNQTIRLNPRFASTHCKLAVLLAAQQKFDEAIASYRRALELQPDLVEALNNLAWMLATNPDARFRDGPEAVRLAERACDLTKYQTPFLIGTLAAAYAEAGRFPEAITTAEKAHTLALATDQETLAKKNLELLELYRAERAYRENPP